MLKFDSIDAILDFAIGEEEAAVNFYTMLAGQIKNEQVRAVFLSYAEEEMRHKAKLLDVKQNGASVFGSKAVIDLKIADYLVDIRPTPSMTYQEALILAMKKEKAAFRLYTHLADRMEDPGMKETFRLLAQEEAKHKLMFEMEYDEYILREN